MSANLYQRLSNLRGQFAYLHQGAYGRGYEGRLISLDPESLELQVYHHDGTPKARVILPVASITSISLGYKELEELSLRVMWANSPDEDAESVDDEALSLSHFDDQPASMGSGRKSSSSSSSNGGDDDSLPVGR